MRLRDLFAEADFVEAIDAGHVSAQEHPAGGLVIYNYTKACQFAHAWNPCTLQCRGLIATADGDVVARPFPKFFNHGEPEAAHLDLHAPCRVTDKLDGSLGILYHDGPASWAIATRGSFASDQALHATRVLQSRYLGGWTPLEGATYLFEIIYPENRIVVDYGAKDDLVLLAALDTETHRELPNHGGWPGETALTFHYRTLAEALAAEPRPNAEGYVLQFDDGSRVKVKQEDYVAMHRIVTGLNERVVWELAGDGVSADDIKAPLPEEFHDWVDDVLVGLRFKADHVWYAARDASMAALDAVHEACPYTDGKPGEDPSFRKEYALHVQRHVPEELRGYCFAMLDGRDIRPAIWRTIRPAGNQGPRKWAEED